jgi:hypothetical protein
MNPHLPPSTEKLYHRLKALVRKRTKLWKELHGTDPEPKDVAVPTTDLMQEMGWKPVLTRKHLDRLIERELIRKYLILGGQTALWFTSDKPIPVKRQEQAEWRKQDEIE